MIKYYDIEAELNKTSGIIPIRIMYFGDLQTIYIERITTTRVWGRHFAQPQSIKLFPNSNIEILKIGAQRVQSKAEFKQEKEDYYDMLSTIAGERKQQLYKDAYRHGKKTNIFNE